MWRVPRLNWLMDWRPLCALLALRSLLASAAAKDSCPLHVGLASSLDAATAGASRLGRRPSRSVKSLLQVRSVMGEEHDAEAGTWPYLEGCEKRLVGNLTKKVLPDYAITVSSFNPMDKSAEGPKVGWGPDRSRMDCNKSCWLSLTNDLKQWIQWDFPSAKKIKRVWTRGRNFAGAMGTEEWVTAYTLEYLDNRTSKKWKQIPGTFEANSDRNTPKENVLNPPVEATSLKLRPTAWKNRIALRAEIIGCHIQAKTTTTTTTSTTTLVPYDYYETPLVGEVLPDCGITASSKLNPSLGPDYSRLQSLTCWAPGRDSDPWIQWDLGVPRIVTRIQLKGCGPCAGVACPMSKALGPFWLSYLDSRKSAGWMTAEPTDMRGSPTSRDTSESLPRMFEGEEEGRFTEYIFRPPLIATSIKLWYVSQGSKGLRAEIIGHAMPLPTAPPKSVPVVCKKCLCEPVDGVGKAIADRCASCAYGINTGFPCNVTDMCRCARTKPMVAPRSIPYFPTPPKPKVKESTKKVPVAYPVPVVVKDSDHEPWRIPKVPYKVPATIRNILKKRLKSMTKEKSKPKVKYVPVSPGSKVPLAGGTAVSGCKAVSGASVVVDNDCSTCAMPEWAESWPCTEPTLCVCTR